MFKTILELPVAIYRAARRCYYGTKHGLRKFLLGYREARILHLIADRCEPPDGSLMKRFAEHEGPNINIAAAEAKLDPETRLRLLDGTQTVKIASELHRNIPQPLLGGADKCRNVVVKTLTLGDGSHIVISRKYRSKQVHQQDGTGRGIGPEI